MKIFVAMLSGFALGLATFGGGFVAAIVFLNAEPVPVRSPYNAAAGVWTREPVRVDTAEQDLARLPDRPSTDSSDAEVQDEAGAEGSVFASEEESLVDATTTAAVSEETTSQPEQQPDSAVLAAHVEWCSERYRSYRRGSNTYTPYSGGQRKCVSPFSDALSPTINLGEDLGHLKESGEGSLAGLVRGDAALEDRHSREHIKSCMARYRSYRPEDNTYQPYGGGPRRQCR